MAYEIMMEIVAASGNKLSGDSRHAANAEQGYTINDVLSVDYSIQKAGDAQGGRHTGEVKALPLRVVKECGVLTPVVLNMIAQNETLQSVTLTFFRSPKKGGKGQELAEKYLTITVSNARITKHKIFTGRAGMEGSQTTAKPNSDYDSREYEEIEFLYDKIDIAYDKGTYEQPGNTMGAYDWRKTHRA